MKSYIPEVNTSIFTKRHNDNIYSENFVDELYDWIEKDPHVIKYPNISYSLFVKTNGNLVNNQTHIPQISVQELQNDMIIPI